MAHDTDPPTIEAATVILEGAAARLAEHFDHVQIVVTYPAPNGATRLVASGEGNWYARLGAVRSWLKRQDTHRGGRGV